MPFALVIIGLIMIVTGAKDTYKEFGSELTADFVGQGNFTWWIASLGAVGALGYIKPLEKFSRMFMALIIVSMLLSNRGFFAQLTGALQQGPTTPQSANDNEADSGIAGLPALGGESEIAKSITGKFDINNFRADPGNAQANFGKVMNIVGMFM